MVVLCGSGSSVTLYLGSVQDQVAKIIIILALCQFLKKKKFFFGYGNKLYSVCLNIFGFYDIHWCYFCRGAT
jgi:hypothetical protein